MKSDVLQRLRAAIAEAGQRFAANSLRAADIELTRPDEQFGDVSTNVVMQRLKNGGWKQDPERPGGPRGIAEAIVDELRAQGSADVVDVSVAGPGFINLTLSDDALRELARQQPAQVYAGKTVITEYSDPNPFKVLHVGHLYTSVVGDGISNLLEASGALVHRTNFGGDVGLHVGKTLWAIIQEMGGEHPEKLADVPEDGRAEWMAQAYVRGTQAYEDDEVAKQAIIAINKQVYQLHADNERDTPFAQIYWTCRQWSYDYFDAFYERIGTPFEKYYPESQTAPTGLETVRQQLDKGVYSMSDGAIVFEGEPYGLHTRVFINSHGLPTYEAKDVGLLMCKWRDYTFDNSIVITGNDIVEYMKVVLKSVEQFEPDLAARSRHITHGNVKLAGGVKMSSRKGNFLRAVDVLDMVDEAAKQANAASQESTTLGAVKYAFLKQRIGADIIFDPASSVSLEGNSGPYLQYAHARARSILRKVAAEAAPDDSAAVTGQTSLEDGERSLLRKISEYHEVVDKSVNELMPHYVCTYLYELAQSFNRFYEHNLVLGDPRQQTRLELVRQYADTLKAGLELLGITAPDQM